MSSRGASGYGATVSEIQVGVKEFMDAQTSDCLYGEKLQNRLAINRINLFTNNDQTNPYLQSMAGGANSSSLTQQPFADQLSRPQTDAQILRQDQSEPAAQQLVSPAEQKLRDQKLQELAKKHNERMQMKLRLKELEAQQ